MMPCTMTRTVAVGLARVTRKAEVLPSYGWNTAKPYRLTRVAGVLQVEATARTKVACVSTCRNIDLSAASRTAGPEACGLPHQLLPSPPMFVAAVSQALNGSRRANASAPTVA